MRFFFVIFLLSNKLKKSFFSLFFKYLNFLIFSSSLFSGLIFDFFYYYDFFLEAMSSENLFSFYLTIVLTNKIHFKFNFKNIFVSIKNRKKDPNLNNTKSLIIVNLNWNLETMSKIENIKVTVWIHKQKHFPETLSSF